MRMYATDCLRVRQFPAFTMCMRLVLVVRCFPMLQVGMSDRQDSIFFLQMLNIMGMSACCERPPWNATSPQVRLDVTAKSGLMRASYLPPNDKQMGVSTQQFGMLLCLPFLENRTRS